MPAPHLYHQSLYCFDQTQPSYWEDDFAAPAAPGPALDADAHCEVAIIGGGYTGLSAALHLVRDYGIDVRLLDAGRIGWGASGRNGGFCTVGGSKLGIAQMLRRYGRIEARRYYQSQAEAIELVRDLGRSEGIDFQAQGDCELSVAGNPRAFTGLRQEAEVLRRVLGLEATILSRGEFAECGYASPQQFGALALRPSFGLHPLRYVHGLAAAAGRHGAHLHPRTEVLDWQRVDGRHRLATAGGTLSAERVIVACNGFMPEHLHTALAGRTLPVQSNIIVSRVLEAAERAAQGWRTEHPAITSGHVFNYFRMLPGGRLMFGGRGGASGDPGEARRVFAALERRVYELWPEWRGLEFTHRWRGLICMTRALHPAIGRFPEDPSVYFAFGYHGNGVNTATWSGRELARWLAGGDNGANPLPEHLPVPVQGLPPRFPLARFRRLYVRAGIGYFRIKDLLD